MTEKIRDGKFVELKYQVIDEKTADVLTAVDFPLGYIHGANDILGPDVVESLEGKAVGEVIEVPFNGDQIFGPRDENLVFTDRLENVPEEYREIGTAVVMENDKGEHKRFIVTRMDDETLTIDGNHPLCGRQVIFKLEILNIRDATEEEIQNGGPIEAQPNIDMGRAIPLD